MPSTHHTAMGLSSSSSATILVTLVLMAFLYVRGWRRMQRASASAIPGWRLASFLFGMSLVWAALGSPLVAYDHDLLTVHMIQHLLLMTFAPALILLGEPLLAFWHGLPRFGKSRAWALCFDAHCCNGLHTKLSRPALCWSVSALTLVGWHVPALFTLGMNSEVWHSRRAGVVFGGGAAFLVAGCSTLAECLNRAAMVDPYLPFSCHAAVRHPLRISCVL